MWNEWKIYERGGVIFSALEPHVDWFKRRVKGREYYNADRAFYGFKGRHLYWCYGQPEYRNNGIAWIKRWVKGGVQGSYFILGKQRYAMCRAQLLQLRSLPLPTSSHGLLTRFDTAHKLLLLHTRQFGISVDAFDDCFEEVVATALKKAGHGKVCEDKKAWSKLLQPAYRSVVMEYKLAVIKLTSSLRAKRSNLMRSPRSDLGVGARDDICCIWGKYFWLTMGWSGTAPISIEDVKQEALKYRKWPAASIRKDRKEILSYTRRIAKSRARIIQQFKIPRSLTAPYLAVLDTFARLHDERKEIQMRTLYALDELRRAAAKRYRVSLKDVQLFTVEETRKFIETGKFPRATITKRRIGYCAKFEHGKMTFEQYGKAALKAIDQELAIPAMDRKEVKGTIASQGHAIGRAIVTDDPKEAVRLIKQGDILITSMTTPDFVPAMKKAGGVVTNEGGVTVHAAIVSREFGIPCITGTLHATHIFKTGDRVEIDAQRGIVKKII